MRTATIVIVFVALLGGPFVTTVRAELEAEQVRTAIDKAVAYLKRTQNNAGEKNDGSWSEHTGQPGGVTALCTLALLNTGLDASDDSVRRGLKYLRTLPPQMTYSTALQTMVFCAAEPNKDRLLIGRNAKWLEEAQIRGGDRKGGWSYDSKGGGGDNSNSQFALLALYEAERTGVSVSDKTWRLALDYWQTQQNPDGSWGYHPGQPGTGSMTCAGIASVIIASGELNGGDAKIVGGRVQCCGEQKANDSVERGIAWLERNFSVHHNPGPVREQSWLLYYLYGVERAGRMTARRLIGDHDWYREGADMLVRKQSSLSGFWKGTGLGEANEHVGTGLALLFLAKGRRPVLSAKLKHGPGDDWNHHRSDLANLTSYVEKAWNRDLTWQVIDPKTASVDELLQVPVLFFNGRDAPQFSAEEKRKLRDYVDRGGFIFAEACCGGGTFDAGFRKLMKEVFPESEYQLRILPPEHPVWHAEEQPDPQYIKRLEGIDVGCRTSVVYCPQDLSCYWELARVGRSQSVPAHIQAEVAAAQSVGINVMAYATNREVKYKLEVPIARAAAADADPLDRGKLYIAKLLHPGGCQVAPGALLNLLSVAGDKLKIRVSTESREVGMADPQIFGYHMVFMHGRQNFRLTPAEKKQLKLYLERGGMIFADSICSSKEFTAAFRREMKALLPDQPLERIPVSHPLFSKEFGGDTLNPVSRRQSSGGAGEGPLTTGVRQGEPYLEGIKIGDRYAVIFSPYDISCALENHESLECEGYIRQDAARIGLNVLLYSLHQ